MVLERGTFGFSIAGFSFFKNIYLFSAVLVFIAAYGLSLFVVSMGYSSLLCGLLSAGSTGSRPAGFSRCSTWAQ